LVPVRWALDLALVHVGADLSNGRDTVEGRVLELLSMESVCAAGWDLGIRRADSRFLFKVVIVCIDFQVSTPSDRK
jgi:hypothetical protein